MTKALGGIASGFMILYALLVGLAQSNPTNAIQTTVGVVTLADDLYNTGHAKITDDYNLFVADYQHAIEKHGESEVKSVQYCLSAKGAEITLKHPLSKRIAKVCRTENGIGVEIDEDDGRFVTAFIPKFRCMFDQVVEYLRQMQYQ